MPNQSFNPIQSVGSTVIPAPSKYDWKLSDVSAADAGRTEDALMHKERIAQKVKLELSWKNATTAECAAVLTAFNPQYISITYLDAKAGDYLTKTFYVGDRSAPLYNARLGLWENVSFNVIEQ